MAEDKKSNANWRTIPVKIGAVEVKKKLSDYNYTELRPATKVLDEAPSEMLTAGQLHTVWAAISTTLDHHLDENNPLTPLQELENLCADLVTTIWDTHKVSGDEI